MQTIQPATLQSATLDELTAKLRQITELQSLKATVDMQLAVLNDDRTKKTEYADVRGFVLGRRPGLIRVQAQVPVTRQKAFDMASDGETFRVYLPWKNQVFEGENRLEHRSEKRTENIRPQHILEPLLIEAPRADEIAVLDSKIEGITAYQVVLFLRKAPDGQPWLARKAWFDRKDMELSRLEIYDQKGNVVTTARYKGWTQEGETLYAQDVVIARPLDGYELSIHFLKPGLNEPAPDESFVLEPPEGVKVERFGEKDADAVTRAQVQ